MRDQHRAFPPETPSLAGLHQLQFIRCFRYHKRISSRDARRTSTARAAMVRPACVWIRTSGTQESSGHRMLVGTKSGGRVHRAPARRCIACCSWRQGNRDPRHPRPGIHRLLGSAPERRVARRTGIAPVSALSAALHSPIRSITRFPDSLSSVLGPHLPVSENYKDSLWGSRFFAKWFGVSQRDCAFQRTDDNRIERRERARKPLDRATPVPGAINRSVTPPVVRPGQHRAAAELEPVVRPQELRQAAFHGQSIQDPRHRWGRTLNRNATRLRWSPALVKLECLGLPGRSRKQPSRSTGRYRRCRTGHAHGHDRSRQSSGILLLLV